LDEFDDVLQRSAPDAARPRPQALEKQCHSRTV